MHRRTSCKPANETVRSSRACRPRVPRGCRATAARRGGAQLTSVRASTKRGRRRSLRGQPARRINRGDGGDLRLRPAALAASDSTPKGRWRGCQSAKPWVSCCGLVPGVGQHEQDQPWAPSMGRPQTNRMSVPCDKRRRSSMGAGKNGGEVCLGGVGGGRGADRAADRADEQQHAEGAAHARRRPRHQALYLYHAVG